ncbi:transposase, MuDR, MULE transposase domain protein [Tanacetum coccineum]|uniref:Transposase, MuDR, MULE transposase domain protein n=1 Tax=Tanacetum coccineum TaxID=301880 RepID=A0ABQ5D9G5_9ASTR
MRPLIIIDAAHLKGTYEGTNLLAVGMDGNNQIIPIATGVSQGETGPSWTWFLSKLKECIGEVPNLSIISDRHASIKSACQAVFPNAFHGYCCRHLLMNCKLKGIRLQCLFWKMCKAYLPEDFNMAINELGATRPDVYHKLTEAGVEKWSRAYCPSDRYNYMTSNSAESINSLTRDVRKIPITNLMEWYRDLVQRWYCERQEKYRDAPLNELSDWAITKITKRRQKSVNWIVGAIDRYIVYHVDDRRRMHTVELYSGTCTCRKWQLSGLPCGHVLAVCRVMGLTDFNHLAKGWFRRKALEGTYQELVYPVGEDSSWQRPNYLQVVKTPLMDKKLAGRPKRKARIRSQGEEPVLVRCGRCGACGHNRNSCRETIPQKKTRYSQQEHSYSEQGHYYSQQAMPFSFEASDLNDP